MSVNSTDPNITAAGPFGTVDIIVLVMYFVSVAATGLYAMCSSKRDTADGYFLAGRFITFVPIGASLFASNIGSEHFIGLAGSGAAAGISVAAFELNALVLLQLLGWVFLPVYLASGVHTLPEYIHKRFGGRRIQVYLAFLSLAIYILTKMSVNLYSGSLFIKVALHWDFVPSILLIISLTAFCTITGGLAAVIYTDTVQAFLMITGGLTLMGFAFNKVGGIPDLFAKYMEAKPSHMLPNSTCGLPREDSLVMLRDPVGSDMPWPGFIFGQTTASIWYWCADQVIVQRALAAKSLSHAQGGALFAGYLKVLPLFMMVMPGMISRILYTDEIACATPEICEQVCHNAAGCSNLAYPKLIMNLMPVGLRGLMVAVMLAALITDLTSIFNSASSLFTMDIYPLIRKNPTNREQMIIGRLFVIIMTLISIFWIPVVENNQGGQLYHYIQSIAAYLTPPIAAIFLIAVLWPRATEKGAFWSLMAGFITGGIRMYLDLQYPVPKCGEIDTRPSIVGKVHYMYFAMILFVQTLVVIIVVSLFTKPHPKWRSIRTVFTQRMDSTIRPDEFSFEVENEMTETLAIESPAIEGVEMEFDFEVKPKPMKKNHSSQVPIYQREESEETTVCDRLGAPSTVDEFGKRKSQKRLVRDWFMYIAGWFCGFSLEETEKKPKKHGSNIEMVKMSGAKEITYGTGLHQSRRETEAQKHVDKLVEAVKQKPRTVTLLRLNLIAILAIGFFIMIFFSIPPQYNGLVSQSH